LGRGKTGGAPGNPPPTGGETVQNTPNPGVFSLDFRHGKKKLYLQVKYEIRHFTRIISAKYGSHFFEGADGRGRV